MRRFDYIRARDMSCAIRALSTYPGAQVLAGGTNIVDLMKYDVAKPATIVDINDLPLHGIIEAPDGALHIGALATNADVAYHPSIGRHFPVLKNAILAGASAQLRNVATVGGNLMQRTRCAYFYDVQVNCNKRNPGSGCPARSGLNRNHAILGASTCCIATNPSDMCVALAALEATVSVFGPNGAREIPIAEFHRLVGDAPEIDTNLGSNEIIVGVNLGAVPEGTTYSYLKIRDRLSYAFAIVSVAALLKIEKGTIAFARLAVGSVAHKPWRDDRVESLLIGSAPTKANFLMAANALVSTAAAQSQNGFKIELTRRAIVRCLTQAAAGTPQDQSDKKIL